MNDSIHQIKVGISYAMKTIMTILVVIAIIRGDLIWGIGAAIALFLTFVPTILERNYHITLPWILEVLIAFALFLHIGGGVLSMYYTIPLYDKFAHFISSFLVAFLGFAMIIILDKYWDGLHMDTKAMVFVVIVSTMAFGVTWEFFEWGSDLVFSTNEQWGLQDTMTDLVIDTIGGIVMATIGVTSLKNGRWEQLTHDFDEDIESFIQNRKNKKYKKKK